MNKEIESWFHEKRNQSVKSFKMNGETWEFKNGQWSYFISDPDWMKYYEGQNEKTTWDPNFSLDK